MKYSEYLQLSDILEKQKISIEEFKYSDLNLNEEFLGNMSIGRLIKYFIVYAGGKSLWNLIKTGVKHAISSGIESSLKEKLDDDAIEIKKIITQKLNFSKDPSTGELNSNDEMIKKLDQEGETTYQAVLKKRYPDFDNKSDEDKEKIKQFIQEKVSKNTDQKIINYMHNILKNQSDVVLKSINQKEKLEPKDKENLLLYWQAKMTMLEVELGIILNQAGYIEEKTMNAFYDALAANYKNFNIPTEEGQNTNIGNILNNLLNIKQ